MSVLFTALSQEPSTVPHAGGTHSANEQREGGAGSASQAGRCSSKKSKSEPGTGSEGEDLLQPGRSGTEQEP